MNNFKKISLGFFTVAVLFFSLSVSAQTTSCLKFPSGTTPPSGYAPSWDIFDSSHTLLVKANCPASGNNLNITIGRGDASQLIYNFAYSYHPGTTPPWQSHSLSGTISPSGWIAGVGTGTMTAPDNASDSNPFFFVGYTCQNRSGVWKCGCVDQACNAGKWQLQAYKGIPVPSNTGGDTAGSATGGSTGTPSGNAAGFPEVKECGSTQNVSGGNISSQASADGCRVIVAAPGSYSGIDISGHSGGVVTVKCQSPGACTAGNSSISNSDGVIFDGFKITAGVIGVDIGSSKNVLVKNSTFIEQTSSGVLVHPGSGQENIQVYDNTFKNDKTGCQYGTNNCTGHLSDGSPVSNMDYGVRVYDAKSVAIRGNTFSSVFNHGISLKTGVKYALIEDNTFNSCGRHCVELGQQPSEPDSIEAMVRNNKINGKMISGVLVEKIQKATITGNIFNLTSGMPIRINNSIKPAGGRTVDQSGNTIK